MHDGKKSRGRLLINDHFWHHGWSEIVFDLHHMMIPFERKYYMFLKPIEVAYIFVSSQFDVFDNFFLRCGSLIFDVVLKFSTEVAEDEILSIIQNAAADGKLEELSVKVLCYVTGIPPVEQTTPGTPVSSNSASNGAILKIGPIFYQFFFLFYICFI